MAKQIRTEVSSIDGVRRTLRQIDLLIAGLVERADVLRAITAPNPGLTRVGGTAALQIPEGITAERPANPVNGMLRYNRTIKRFEAYEDGAWVSLASTSYTPAVPDDWEDADPTTRAGALDRIAGGHAGVCLISTTKPTAPAEGQLRLDTSMAGSSGLGTLNFITITADLVLTSSHTLVYADASAGPIVVTVPAAVGNGRKLYAIVKTDASANTVTMDGGFDAVLTCQDEAVPIHSEGTDWRIPF